MSNMIVTNRDHPLQAKEQAMNQLMEAPARAAAMWSFRRF
jgi:hypothetical protein